MFSLIGIYVIRCAIRVIQLLSTVSISDMMESAYKFWKGLKCHIVCVRPRTYEVCDPVYQYLLGVMGFTCMLSDIWIHVKILV